MKFITHISVLALVGVATLLTVSSAHARSDAAFLKDAAEAGEAELRASKVAQTKARRSEVRSFADTMVTEHSRMSEELKRLAAAKRVTLPSAPGVLQQSKLKLIEAGDDDKFDERYVSSFGVKAHEDTIKLFEEAARTATDAEVKAFAQKSLPVLQHHLQMARSLGIAK
jgi:putative membrane protein